MGDGVLICTSCGGMGLCCTVAKTKSHFTRNCRSAMQPERGSNSEEPTEFALASRVVVCPLPPSRGVYDARPLCADHDETRGKARPSHDTDFFPETSRQWSAPDRRQTTTTRSVGRRIDEPCSRACYLPRRGPKNLRRKAWKIGSLPEVPENAVCVCVCEIEHTFTPLHPAQTGYGNCRFPASRILPPNDVSLQIHASGSVSGHSALLYSLPLFGSLGGRR